MRCSHCAQLRAYSRWLQRAQLHARGAALPPVAARVQRADPRARGDARRRACSTATRAACSSRPRAPFEPAARRVLDDMTRAIADVHDHAAQRRGRVALAPAAVARGRLAAGRPGASSRSHPGITVDVADALSEPCIAQVRRGRPTSRSRPGAPRRRDLRREVFCSDGFHLVCRADHPLAAATAITAARPRRRGRSSTCRATAACASPSTRRCTRCG